MQTPTFTAFSGQKFIRTGDLESVALAAKAAHSTRAEMPLVFNDLTGAIVDLDLRGSDSELLGRLKLPPASSLAHKPARGRPKLGVTPREVTLLPRHWEWLGSQPGGASATLRKLVERASKENADVDATREAQTAAYKVMHALAGELRDYEEALRALYAPAPKRVREIASTWPKDIGDYVIRLVDRAFETLD
jgi:hypothetical protein